MLMAGCQGRWTNTWGLWGCTDILADQLPSPKPFCGIASLALAALTRLLFGSHAAVKTRVALQTSVHAFIEVLHLPPFYTSAFPSSPRVHVSSPGAR